MGKWKQWGFSWCLHYKIWRKFLEKTNLLAFSEVERLNAICMNEMPGFQSRVGAPAIKHEFQPFGRLNSCGVSPLQPVLELSAQEIGQTYCRKFLDFLVATVYFPSTQPTVGVRNPPVPNPIHQKNPLVAQNHWARLCISSAPLQSTERDAWWPAIFEHLPAWEAPREMAHDRWRDQTSVCVKPPKVHQKAREKNWSGRRIKLSRTPDPMVRHLYLELVGFYGKGR